MHDDVYAGYAEKMGGFNTYFCSICEAVAAHLLLDKDGEVFETLCDSHAHEFRMYLSGYNDGRSLAVLNPNIEPRLSTLENEFRKHTRNTRWLLRR